MHESTEPERSRVLQSAGPLQDAGESREEGQSPQKQHPAGAGLAGTLCSLRPCTAAVCRHAGLEGWAAAAPGAGDLPLRWADGEIIAEWDGEEPVDFLAPGIVPGVLLCCGVPTMLSWDIPPLSWCMRCWAASWS